MGKLLPILLVLLGLGAGGGAGYLLRPPPEDEAQAMAECPPPAGDAHEGDTAESEAAAEYVKLNNQFIVPIVEKGTVRALVILSLSLEVDTGMSEKVFLHEPKLRDLFLGVLFDHANTGGFDGTFTASGTMEGLRRALGESARSVLGKGVRDVLILDIVRQDA